MQIGKEYIFITDIGKPNVKYFKGKLLSVALKYVYTIFTEGKTVVFTRDDNILHCEDESEIVYPRNKEKQMELLHHPHKFEMILLHCIETKNKPLTDFILPQCDLSFIYKKSGTALEIAMEHHVGFMVQLLIQKRAAFSKTIFLKKAIYTYPYPLQIYNVSKITDMSYLFKDYEFTDDDISQWDVSKVNDMSGLFMNSNFQGDISGWNVSNVKNMKGMFFQTHFDGDLSQWNVSNVRDMVAMFRNSDFQGDISRWNVSNVIYMNQLFMNSLFDGDISTWDVSKVENMSEMFRSSSFQGDLSSWKVSRVKYMNHMFFDSVFDGDLSSWDVSNVKDMREMFAHSPFQQDISSWNSIGKKMDHMFTDCPIREYFKPTYQPFIPLLSSSVCAGRRTRKVFQLLR
jgi:surface protein